MYYYYVALIKTQALLLGTILLQCGKGKALRVAVASGAFPDRKSAADFVATCSAGFTQLDERAQAKWYQMTTTGQTRRMVLQTFAQALDEAGLLPQEPEARQVELGRLEHGIPLGKTEQSQANLYGFYRLAGRLRSKNSRPRTAAPPIDILSQPSEPSALETKGGRNPEMVGFPPTNPQLVTAENDTLPPPLAPSQQLQLEDLSLQEKRELVLTFSANKAREEASASATAGSEVAQRQKPTIPLNMAFVVTWGEDVLDHYLRQHHPAVVVKPSVEDVAAKAASIEALQKSDSIFRTLQHKAPRVLAMTLSRVQYSENPRTNQLYADRIRDILTDPEVPSSVRPGAYAALARLEQTKAKKFESYLATASNPASVYRQAAVEMLLVENNPAAAQVVTEALPALEPKVLYRAVTKLEQWRYASARPVLEELLKNSSLPQQADQQGYPLTLAIRKFLQNVREPEGK